MLFQVQKDYNMYKLISDILENFKAEKESQNIIMELIKFIIDKGYFDVGAFVIFDYISKDDKTKSFRLGGIYPDDNEAKKEIEETISDNPIILDSVLNEKCGLFHYVIRSFLDNNDEECYKIVSDKKKFIKNDKAGKYFIDIKYNQKVVVSEIVFPVSITFKQKEVKKRLIQAVLVFESFSEKDYSVRDVKVLSNIFNQYYIKHINNHIDSTFLSIINSLSITKDDIGFSGEDESIKDAFKVLYENKKNANFPINCKLKYGSLYSMNDIHFNNKQRFFLVKNQAFNFSKSHYEFANLIDERLNEEDRKHLYYEFMENLRESLGDSLINGNLDFLNFIKQYSFGDVSSKFYHPVEFSNAYGIKNEDIVILLPIIPNSLDLINIFSERLHFDNLNLVEIQSPKEVNIILKKFTFKLIVLFFDKDTYSYYYKNDFLELVSYKIYENFLFVIQKIRRKLRKELLKNFTIENLSDEKNLYSNAASVITSIIGNESVDEKKCNTLIYLLEDNETRLLLKSPEIRELPKEIELNKNTNGTCHSVTELIKYMDDLIKSEKMQWEELKPFIWYDKEKTNNSRIYSIMALPIRRTNGTVNGFVIMLNNKITLNNRREKSCFSEEEYEIAFIAAVELGKYSEIIDYKKNFGAMLKKLEHEIPAQCKIIYQNTFLLREIFRNEGLKEYFKNNLDIPPVKYLLDLTFELEYANMRISFLADYNRLVYLPTHLLKDASKPLNIKTFLSTIIPTLRSESKRLGNEIYFELQPDVENNKLDHIINQHPVIQLALINIINNAIQYSYSGTAIQIKCISKGKEYHFEVENLGIPLNIEEKDKIFKEGYRTKEAKEKYFLGTGFGLYYTKVLLDKIDCKIKIETDNDFCNRNIFAINQFPKMLKDFGPIKDNFGQFLDINDSNLVLTNDEISILKKYSRLLVTNPFILYNYFMGLLKENHSIKNLLDSVIDNKISRIKFSLIFQKG